MALSITNIGHNGGLGSTVLIAGVTVPAGAAIVVTVQDSTGNPVGTVSDNVNGAYTKIASQPGNNDRPSFGESALYYFPNSASLSGATITYTVSGGSGSGLGVSAAYIAGVSTSPLDPAVTAVAFGNSGAPSVTSGSPSQSGSMFVAFVGGFRTGSNTFTQDTTHNWNSTPTGDNSTNGFEFPGSQVNAGGGALVFAPTLGNSAGWAAIVASFVPMTQPYQPQYQMAPIMAQFDAIADQARKLWQGWRRRPSGLLAPVWTRNSPILAQ